MPPITESLCSIQSESAADPVLAHADGDTLRADRAPTDPQTEVMREMSTVIARVKDAVEEKNWRGVADILGLHEVYLNGHPEDVEDLLLLVEKQSRDLFDFEPILQRIISSHATPTRARFTVQAKLVWHSTLDWRDHEVEQTVHLGFANKNGVWSVSHLGFSAPPTPPAAPAPTGRKDEPAAAPAAASSASSEAEEWRSGESRPTIVARQSVPTPIEGIAPPPPMAGDSPSRLSDQFLAQLATNYISSLSRAKAEAPKAPTTAALTAVAGSDGKHHVVFMPVVVPEALARHLFAAT